MNPNQKRLARHALGLDNPDARGKSYRNRYFMTVPSNVTAPIDWVDWLDLMKQRLATGYRSGNTQYCFRLTSAGAALALEPGETLCSEDFPSEAA